MPLQPASIRISPIRNPPTCLPSILSKIIIFFIINFGRLLPNPCVEFEKYKGFKQLIPSRLATGEDGYIFEEYIFRQ